MKDCVLVGWWSMEEQHEYAENLPTQPYVDTKVKEFEHLKIHILILLRLLGLRNEKDSLPGIIFSEVAMKENI
jgi:hypothetical protein